MSALPPPSAAAIKMADDLILQAIIEYADLGASLSRSVAEAAFREDRLELRVQLLRLRATIVEMLRSYRDLSPAESEKAEAA
jgi:hypothetical protein